MEYLHILKTQTTKSMIYNFFFLSAALPINILASPKACSHGVFFFAGAVKIHSSLDNANILKTYDIINNEYERKDNNNKVVVTGEGLLVNDKFGESNAKGYDSKIYVLLPSLIQQTITESPAAETKTAKIKYSKQKREEVNKPTDVTKVENEGNVKLESEKREIAATEKPPPAFDSTKSGNFLPKEKKVNSEKEKKVDSENEKKVDSEKKKKNETTKTLVELSAKPEKKEKGTFPKTERTHQKNVAEKKVEDTKEKIEKKVEYTEDKKIKTAAKKLDVIHPAAEISSSNNETQKDGNVDKEEKVSYLTKEHPDEEEVTQNPPHELGVDTKIIQKRPYDEAHPKRQHTGVHTISGKHEHHDHFYKHSLHDKDKDEGKENKIFNEYLEHTDEAKDKKDEMKLEAAIFDDTRKEQTVKLNNYFKIIDKNKMFYNNLKELKLASDKVTTDLRNFLSGITDDVNYENFKEEAKNHAIAETEELFMRRWAVPHTYDERYHLHPAFPLHHLHHTHPNVHDKHGGEHNNLLNSSNYSVLPLAREYTNETHRLPEYMLHQHSYFQHIYPADDKKILNVIPVTLAEELSKHEKSGEEGGKTVVAQSGRKSTIKSLNFFYKPINLHNALAQQTGSHFYANLNLLENDISDLSKKLELIKEIADEVRENQDEPQDLKEDEGDKQLQDRFSEENRKVLDKSDAEIFLNLNNDESSDTSSFIQTSF